MLRYRPMVVCLLMALFLSGTAWGARQTINIAILSDGQQERANIDSELLKREITDLLQREFDVQFDERYRWIGNWDIARIEAQNEQALADKNIDLVISMGVLGAHYMGSRGNLPKPVVAPFVVNPELQGIKLVDGRSGTRNFTYITQGRRPSEVIGAFQKITPFSSVAVLAEDAIIQLIPELQVMLDKYSLLVGMKMDLISAGTSGAEALSKVGKEYDAILLAPLPRFNLDDIKVIAEGASKRGLLAFSMNGRDEVEQGLLAGFAAEDDEKRLARRVALNVQRILLGEKPESISVVFESSDKVILNQDVARKLDVYPDFDTIDQYEVINRGDFLPSRAMGLKDAMKQAMQRNLNVAAIAYQTSANEAQLKSFRARLLPDLDAGAEYRVIDDDRTKLGMPEKQTSAQISLTQILYSDEALGFYDAQKNLQLSQEQILEQARLDAALNAATTYLNLLQARKVEALQKDNLERAGRNLELAKIRKRVGTASAGEVYRWESEIATSRSNYVQAKALANQLNVALLQLLNLPQVEQLELEEVSLESTGFFFNDARFDDYVKTPWSFRKFHDFMVAEAMLQAPELKEVQAQLKAQERSVTTARRKHWAPLVTATGSMSEVLERGGENGVDVPGQDDTNWQLGVNVSLPLYSGGADSADVAEARETLLALRVQESAIRSAIEQQVRSQLLEAEASYPTMQYAADAARAAKQNLDLITDAYKRGTVSILDLIDAQNAALSAEINAANSVYDFMNDYFGLERIIGRFDALSTNKDKDDWYQRMDQYFNK